MARGRPSMGGYPKNTTFLSLLRNLGARSFDTRPRSPASIPDRSRSPGLLRNSAALERRGLLHHTALGWPDCSGIWLPFYGGYPKVVPVAGWRATALRNKPFW